MWKVNRQLCDDNDRVDTCTYAEIMAARKNPVVVRQLRDCGVTEAVRAQNDMGDEQ